MVTTGASPGPHVLEDSVAAAYLWIASRGQIYAGETQLLAEHLGVTVGTAAETVRILRSRGLLSTTTNRERFEPANPRIASAILLAPSESVLEQSELKLYDERRRLSRLRSDLARLPLSAGEPQTETIDNVYAVDAYVGELAGACQSELMVCQPAGRRPQEGSAGVLPRDLALLARGIRLPMLCRHTSRFHRPTQAYAAAVSAAGAEIRTLPDVPPMAIVIDRQIALVPHNDHEGGAAVVRDPSVVAHLCASFEQAWHAAAPYRTGPAAARKASDDLRTTIIQMLGNGLKDEVIARRLGLSVRSLRGHIAEIMSQLGAVSRFQAGVHAAQNEWLAAERVAPRAG